MGHFNLKGSYSHAFRAPLIENIAANLLIRPEKTVVSEIELAYKLNTHWLMSVNIFDIAIADPIVYGTDGIIESYHNYSALGTRGAEAELNYRSDKLRLTANYSYYINTKNDVQTFATPNKEMLIGFANYKVTANAAYDLSNNISLTANIVYLNNKYAYTGVDGDGNRTLSLLAPTYTLNSKINFANFEQLKGLSFGIGCYNALDNKYFFVQAYQGDLNPISSLGREWVLNVKYMISKTK